MDGVIGDRKKVKDVYLFYTKQTRGQSASSLFNFSTQIFPFKVLPSAPQHPADRYVISSNPIQILSLK